MGAFYVLLSPLVIASIYHAIKEYQNGTYYWEGGFYIIFTILFLYIIHLYTKRQLTIISSNRIIVRNSFSTKTIRFKEIKYVKYFFYVGHSKGEKSMKSLFRSQFRLEIYNHDNKLALIINYGLFRKKEINDILNSFLTKNIKIIET